MTVYSSVETARTILSYVETDVTVNSSVEMIVYSSVEMTVYASAEIAVVLESSVTVLSTVIGALVVPPPSMVAGVTSNVISRVVVSVYKKLELALIFRLRGLWFPNRRASGFVLRIVFTRCH